MKSIIKYVADDGAEFTTETKCAEYEALCAEIAAVVGKLKPIPKDDGCRFANGGGFIQQDEATFREVRRGLLLIAQRVCPMKWIDESLADETVHASWAGRIIGESSRPLSSAWNRIHCTDGTFREWGQPYYAMHPDQGTQAPYSA